MIERFYYSYTVTGKSTKGYATIRKKSLRKSCMHKSKDK